MYSFSYDSFKIERNLNWYYTALCKAMFGGIALKLNLILLLHNLELCSTYTDNTDLFSIWRILYYSIVTKEVEAKILLL